MYFDSHVEEAKKVFLTEFSVVKDRFHQDLKLLGQENFYRVPKNKKKNALGFLMPRLGIKQPLFAKDQKGMSKKRLDEINYLKKFIKQPKDPRDIARVARKNKRLEDINVGYLGGMLKFDHLNFQHKYRQGVFKKNYKKDIGMTRLIQLGAAPALDLDVFFNDVKLWLAQSSDKKDIFRRVQIAMYVCHLLRSSETLKAAVLSTDILQYPRKVARVYQFKIKLPSDSVLKAAKRAPDGIKDLLSIQWVDEKVLNTYPIKTLVSSGICQVLSRHVAQQATVESQLFFGSGLEVRLKARFWKIRQLIRNISKTCKQSYLLDYLSSKMTKKCFRIKEDYKNQVSHWVLDLPYLRQIMGLAGLKVLSGSSFFHKYKKNQVLQR